MPEIQLFEWTTKRCPCTISLCGSWMSYLIRILTVQGHDKIVAISTSFYTKVYADTEVWHAAHYPSLIPQESFRSMFRSDIKDAIQDQYEVIQWTLHSLHWSLPMQFFIQRMGGPPLYSNRKGRPSFFLSPQVYWQGILLFVDVTLNFKSPAHMRTNGLPTWIKPSTITDWPGRKRFAPVYLFSCSWCTEHGLRFL